MARRRYLAGCAKVIHASRCWGVGVLPKGPVALVLVGVPMVAWSLVTRALAQPVAAFRRVVQYNGKAWVYLQLDDKTFTRREVALEIPAADGWFISQGLTAKDRIVVNGAQTLLSEELKCQVTTEDLG